MPDGKVEETVDSFPTYADLTQTRGWSHAASSPVTSAFEDTADLGTASRYTEGALLGIGGMGKVLLAHDARIGREVAVKQLHSDRELSPEERARFLREARVQGQLEHPSIVPVYDIDARPDGTTFFTMRRVVGRTLHAILDDLRAGEPAAVARYTQRELLTAFATVCLTVDYAHSRGVIHRDIKPANIMLGDFGEVYVLDWGLARIVGDSQKQPVGEDAAARLSVTGEMMGTPLYMAPEQMVDPAVGAAADVFALGTILFEILTLQRLRDARTLYLPAEARPSVRTPDRTVAPELETICVRATQSLPADRYPSARALQEAIVGYLEGDRDAARRKELAAKHIADARSALARADEHAADYERHRTHALRDVGRATILDPTNGEYLTMFTQIWTTPPRTIPRAVREQLRAGEQMIVKTGTQRSIIAGLIWFLFLPVVMYIGVREWNGVALVLVAAGLWAAIAAVAYKMQRVPPWLQLAVIAMSVVAMGATTLMWGPLIIVPTLIGVMIITMQMHPARWFRLSIWAIGGLTLIGLTVVELVWPTSYVFDGRMIIVPNMIELPRVETLLLILAASLCATLFPGLIIGQLRVALTEAQLQLHLREWHYKRLGGDVVTALRT